MATKIGVTCKIGGSEVRIDAELEKFSQKSLLKMLSDIEDLTVSTCGLCKSTSLRARVRKHGEYVFFELLCRDCGGTLQYGQLKDGSGLFPKEWAEPYQGGGGDDDRDPTPPGWD